MRCIQCGFTAPSGPGNTWPPRWGCLYGILCVCSLSCAEAYAAKQRYKTLRDGDLDTEPDFPVEPQGKA